ncbi:glycosyltransferase family 4 protein [Burkholderiales bacterium]|nr:glycosyltransferase family 4 protein [Burkholderiales bacterium]
MAFVFWRCHAKYLFDGHVDQSESQDDHQLERKRLKILVLSFYFRPDLSAGSFRTTAFVDSLKEQLPVDGRIEVLTTFPNRYNSFSVEASTEERLPGVSIFRIELPRHQSGMFDQVKAFVSFARAVLGKTQGQKYDLVFATSSRLMTAVLGAYVARRNRTPLYLDLRDIFVDTIKDVLPRYLAILTMPIFTLLERWAINSACKVNLVSKGFSGYFSTRYPKQKFSYFTNGIDDEFLSLPSPESVLRTDGMVEVLYAGNLGEGQGLHAIIPDLAKRMQGRVRFTIIGDGGRKDALRAALISAGVDNVVLMPPIKREQLIKAYLAADVLFLHLNEYDAFRKVLPSKLFEYGAMGKPIWAGVSGYAAEFVRTELDNAVIFHPCDAAEAERVFSQLRLQNGSRDRFVDKFARAKISNELAADVLRTIG